MTTAPTHSSTVSAGPDAPAVVEARGVGRRDPKAGPGSDHWLIRDVGLAVRPGDRLALVGPSGSGKTVLLRALARLDPVDAGAVVWQGREVAGVDVPGFRAQVVYLHQRPAIGAGTVEDNLRAPYALKAHRAARFDRERVVALLDRLGRDASFLGKSGRDLSGGEGQVVGLVRALQLDPLVVLLDEPTASLDPDAARGVEAAVGDWLDADPRRATVWVSHDPAQAGRVSARAVRLRDGRLDPGGGP